MEVAERPSSFHFSCRGHFSVLNFATSSGAKTDFAAGSQFDSGDLNRGNLRGCGPPEKGPLNPSRPRTPLSETMFSPAEIDFNHMNRAGKPFMQAHTRTRRDCWSWMFAWWV